MNVTWCKSITNKCVCAHVWLVLDERFRCHNNISATGNNNLNLLTTSGKRIKLRFDLADFSGNHRYAEYDNFIVLSSTDHYKLSSIGRYSGTAGEQHNNIQCSNTRGVLLSYVIVLISDRSFHIFITYKASLVNSVNEYSHKECCVCCADYRKIILFFISAVDEFWT